MWGDWPLVGRNEELSFVLESVKDPSSQGVVLAGAAGVGKTRLALEALETLRGDFAATEWSIATSSAATIPFAALAGLLPAHESNAPADRLDLFRRFLDEMGRRAGDGGFILGVDDAHLLDDASAALLLHVAHSKTIRLVVTVRSGEEAPDPVKALWKEGLLQRLEVQALAEEEVRELLVKVLGGPVDRATLFKLWKAGQGNALFLRELILDGLDTGKLLDRGGIWRWHGDLSAGPRLAEVFGVRLERMDPGEREMLEVVALGEPVEGDVLQAMSAPGAIDSAERKGMIRTERIDRRILVRLAHPLYGDVIRSEIPELRARAVRLALAERVIGTGCGRWGDVLRVATWRLDAGDTGHPEILVQGADQALAAFDFDLAERLARASLDGEWSFRAAFLLGDSLRSLGRADEAETLLDELESRAEGDEERAAATSLRAYNLFFGKQDAELAEEVMHNARSSIKNSVSCDELAAQQAILSLYAGRPEKAGRTAERVFASPSASHVARLDATVAAAPALAMCGQSERGLRLVSAAMDLLPEVPLRASAYTGQFMAIQFLILRLSGRLREAENLADGAYSFSVAHGSHDGMALMSGALGQAALLTGRVKTAIERLTESTALLREHDRNGFLPWTLSQLLNALVLAGELSAAEAAFEEAESLRTSSIRLFICEYELARAWLTASKGEISSARAIAIAAADAAAADGALAYELMALHDAARLGGARQVGQRVKFLATKVDGDLAQAWTAHVAALQPSDPYQFDVASEMFEALGMKLLAAEASSAAQIGHRKDGRIARALASSRRCTDLLEDCEGARTPVMRYTSEPSPLTEREREVVFMAAQGLSSKQIAERLVVSIRTVDNHLHHAYGKLGVRSREELVEVIGNPGDKSLFAS